jgi:hypothetical protein
VAGCCWERRRSSSTFQWFLFMYLSFFGGMYAIDISYFALLWYRLRCVDLYLCLVQNLEYWYVGRRNYLSAVELFLFGSCNVK